MLDKLLADALTHGSREALRELSKDGTLTGEKLIEAFSKTNTALNAQFENPPTALNMAFTKNNESHSTYAAAQTWKSPMVAILVVSFGGSSSPLTMRAAG